MKARGEPLVETEAAGGDRRAVARRRRCRRARLCRERPPHCAIEVLDPAARPSARPGPALPALDAGPPFDRTGTTLLEAVMLGVGDALRADPRVFVFGEDVGGTYGNAFLLLRPLLEEFGDRIINSPLAEGAVLGVCVGAALAGQRPIGEMQFNDFVATGFNQLVNNAAKIRYRWGGSVPMVVRMPWGGLRSCRPVPQPEHRAVVLSHAGAEDRRAVDAARRARADGEPRSPIPIRCSTTSTSRSIAIRASSRRSERRAGADADRHGGAPARRQRPRDHLVRRLRARRAARRRAARGRRDRGERPRSPLARAARSRAPCWPARATAAAC